MGNGLFRVFGAPVGLSRIPVQRLCRIAKSLGLPSNATGQDIIHKINKAKKCDAVPPKEVSSGPVKEYKIFGDNIDLTSLPVPLLHAADGGKFIQTFGMYVVQTPDKRWVNWSITRGMVNDKRSLVGPIIPKQDIGVISQMWKERNEDLPFALCFGVPPAAIMVGGVPIPKWTNEAGFIGALTGKPVEVVKCGISNILVPAHAEIVLEGVVLTSEDAKATEGPMGEYHGMIFPGQSKQCPIFQENHTVRRIMQAAEVLNVCQNAGLPIQMVWCSFESHCLWFVVQVDRQKLRAMNTIFADFSTKLGDVVFGSKPGWYIPKIFLVGEDIDPTNLRDVIWAESTRCQPGRNGLLFGKYGIIPLIPYVGYGIKLEGTGNHQNVVRCCMLPCEFVDESLFWKEGSSRGSYPIGIQEKVNRKWQTYGFSR
ncbi:hypothetical protein N7486_009295 [Penicillium sp. IBT 16267x]|nr:hypothetical protein N7486_009295 [Penicillium sp. IBT 16267x]